MDLISGGQQRRDDGMAGHVAIPDLSGAAGESGPERGCLAEGACRSSRPLRAPLSFGVQQKTETTRKPASR